MSTLIDAWLATDHAGAVYLPDVDLEPTWVHPAPWVNKRRTRSAIGVPLPSDA